MPLSPAELEAVLLPPALEIAGASRGQVKTMGGDASNRRYHRVHLSGGRLPSLVVMELPRDALRSEEGPPGQTAVELPFLNVHRYLEAGKLPVPAVHRYLAAEGLVYLEDLGDVTLEQAVTGADRPIRLRYYKRAIDLLIEMQRYAAGRADAGCLAFGRGFDQELLRWELDHFREWELLEDGGARLAPTDERLLGEQFDRLAATLAAEPRHFVHRDFQSRNLMVQHADSFRLRLIDFQDALLGTRAYDLVALLRDSYVMLSPEELDELLTYYMDRGLADAERSGFRRLFDLQTVQRKLKDAGRFVFIDRVKNNPSFRRHVPASLRYVREALGRLPEHAPLGDLLKRYLPAHFA